MRSVTLKAIGSGYYVYADGHPELPVYSIGELIRLSVAEEYADDLVDRKGFAWSEIRQGDTTVYRRDRNAALPDAVSIAASPRERLSGLAERSLSCSA